MSYSGQTGNRALNRFLANRGLIQNLESTNAEIGVAAIGEVETGYLQAAQGTIADLSAVNLNITNEVVGETILFSTATFTNTTTTNLDTTNFNATDANINTLDVESLIVSEAQIGTQTSTNITSANVTSTNISTLNNVIASNLIVNGNIEFTGSISGAVEAEAQENIDQRISANDADISQLFMDVTDVSNRLFASQAQDDADLLDVSDRVQSLENTRLLTAGDTMTGALGIGTTNIPTVNVFEVSGNSRFYGDVRVDGSFNLGPATMTLWDDNGKLRFLHSGGKGIEFDFITDEPKIKPLGTSTNVQFQNESAGENPQLDLGTNGRVGIGTTDPSAALHVSGGIVLTGDSSIGVGTVDPEYDVDIRGILRNINDAYLATTSGNVGIGTTSPSYKLDVSGNARIVGNDVYIGASTNDGQDLHIVNSNSSLNGHTIKFTDGTTTYSHIYNNMVGNSGDSNRYLNINQNDSGLSSTTGGLTITNGNIGIDTVNPAYKLDVNGNSIQRGIQHYQEGSSGQRFASYVYNDKFEINPRTESGVYAGLNTFIMDGSGRIGINNVNPAYKLDIRGDSGSGNFNVLRLSRPNTADDSTTIPIDFNVSTTDHTVARINSYYTNSGSGGSGGLRFSTRDIGTLAERMRIIPSGYIGIGLSAPTRNLDVNGSFGNTTNAYFATSSGNVGVGTTSPSYKLDVNGTLRNTGNALLATSGNVGVGTTSPSYNLDISGTLRNTTGAVLAATSGNVGIGTMTPNAIYVLDVNGTTRTRNNTYLATSSGNVGIGKTSASHTLDVNGSFQSSGPTFLGINDQCIGVSKNSAAYNLDVSGVMRSTQSAYLATNGGNVGIGTEGPTARLDVDSGSLNRTQGIRIDGNQPGFSIASTAAGGKEYNMWSTSATGETAGDFRFYQQTDSRDILWVNGTTGNVGVGTTITPSASYKLDVNGTFRNTTGAVLASSSGNVGIGTTDPSDKLHVIGNILASGTNPNLTIQHTSGQSLTLTAGTVGTLITNTGWLNLNGGNVGVNNGSTAGSYNLDVNGTFRNTTGAVLASSSGNVGIGTTSPGYKLDVNGTFRNTTGAILASSSGNVGIGTSPSYKLDVNGSSQITQTTLTDNALTLQIPGGADSTIGYSSSIIGKNTQFTMGSIGFLNTMYSAGGSFNGAIVFNTNLSDTLGERMRIANDGNVGIGTTAPSEKLHVIGNILATGTITPFTGSHIANSPWLSSLSIDISMYNVLNGLIVSSTGKNYRSKEPLNFFIENAISTKAYDKRVSGIFYYEHLNRDPSNNPYESFQVSLGEGMMWVCDICGTIENGDYITSSEIYGFGMPQNDDLLHNYTVAKSYEDVDFTDYERTIDVLPDKMIVKDISRNELFTFDGTFNESIANKTYRAKSIGCTFHCG